MYRPHGENRALLTAPACLVSFRRSTPVRASQMYTPFLVSEVAADTPSTSFPSGENVTSCMGMSSPILPPMCASTLPVSASTTLIPALDPQGAVARRMLPMVGSKAAMVSKGLRDACELSEYKSSSLSSLSEAEFQRDLCSVPDATFMMQHSWRLEPQASHDPSLENERETTPPLS